MMERRHVADCAVDPALASAGGTWRRAFEARCRLAADDLDDRLTRYVSSWRDWDAASATLWPWLCYGLAGRFPWEVARTPDADGAGDPVGADAGRNARRATQQIP